MRGLLHEGKLKGMKDILSLFAQRGEIRAEGAEGLRIKGSDSLIFHHKTPLIFDPHRVTP